METGTSSRAEKNQGMTEGKRLTPAERKALAIRGARAAEANKRAEARRELASRMSKAVEETVLKMPDQLWDRVVGFGGSFDVDVPSCPSGRALRLKVKASRKASMAEISAARGLAGSSDSNLPRPSYEEKVKDLQERAAAANARQATFYPMSGNS